MEKSAFENVRELQTLVRERGWKKLGFQVDLISKEMESHPESKLHVPEVYESIKLKIREMTATTMSSRLSMDNKRLVLKSVASLGRNFLSDL